MEMKGLEHGFRELLQCQRWKAEGEYEHELDVELARLKSRGLLLGMGRRTINR